MTFYLAFVNSSDYLTECLEINCQQTKIEYVDVKYLICGIWPG